MRIGEFEALKKNLDPKVIIENMVEYLYGKPKTLIHDDISKTIEYFNGVSDCYGGWSRNKPKSLREYLEIRSSYYITNNTYLAPAIGRVSTGISTHLSKQQIYSLFNGVNTKKIFADKVFELWKLEDMTEEGMYERRRDVLAKRIEQSDSKNRIEQLLTLCKFKKSSSDIWKKGNAKFWFDGIYMNRTINDFIFDSNKEPIDFGNCMRWILNNGLYV